MIKKILTHTGAFIAGVLAVTVVGLIVCEMVENFDTDGTESD